MKSGKYAALLRIDSQGIIHNIPNAQYEKWKINSLGFRGKEIDAEKKRGQIRVICFGGSETFGVYESEGKEWPSQLETLLKDRFPHAEVINISVIGLHAKKRKEYIEKYVLPLKPDILVLFHHRFLIHTKDSIRGVEKNFIGTLADGEESNDASKPRGFFSHLVLASKKTVEKGLPKGLSNLVGLWSVRQKIRRKEKRHLRGAKPLDEVPEPVVLSYGRDLKSFARYLREKDIIPVLSTFPSLISSSNKNQFKYILMGTRNFFCIELSENGTFSAIGQLNGLIRKIADEEKTVLTDIDGIIPKTLEYFIDNFHYTDKGAELVAKNIYDLLTHSGLLK